MNNGRFLYQTDNAELERRWKVTLEAMEKEGIDCLLIGVFSKFIAGPAKYLTDMHAQEYPFIYLFGKEGISIFGTGASGGPAMAPHLAYRNIAENIGVPTVPMSSNALNKLPEEVKTVIGKYGHKRIGVTNWYNIPASVYRYLTENLPDAEFVDFSDQMDRIMAVKSPYEIGLYKKCVELHDMLMACAPAFVRPGRTEWDIVHDFRKLAVELGCEELNVLVTSDSLARGFHPFMYTHKVVEREDVFSLLIEVSGPGGVWGEVGRACCFTEPPEELVKLHGIQVELQAWIAEQSKPGVKVSDIHRALNEKLEGMGYDLDRRFTSHGQGYSLVDRPVYTSFEDMIIEENMFLAIHPRVGTKDLCFSNCDNYLVGADGAVRLNRTPTDIIVIDHFEK